MAYVTVLPHTPTSLKSLVQTSGHKVAAHMDVFSQLSNITLFFTNRMNNQAKTTTTKKQKKPHTPTSMCVIFIPFKLPGPMMLLQLPFKLKTLSTPVSFLSLCGTKSVQFPFKLKTLSTPASFLSVCGTKSVQFPFKLKTLPRLVQDAQSTSVSFIGLRGKRDAPYKYCR